MKRLLSTFCFFIFVAGCWHGNAFKKGKPYQAICCVPVADMHTGFIPKWPGKLAFHTNGPICFADHARRCSRGHQLLFNEIVTVVKMREDYAFVAIESASLKKRKKGYTASKYWVNKSSIVPLETLDKRGINLANLPPAVSFNDASTLCPDNLVTLGKSWQSPDGRLLCAGVRFMCDGRRDARTTGVWMLDSLCSKVLNVDIPTENLIKASDVQAKSITRRISDFLGIIRSWCRNDDGFIPYVWSGRSPDVRCTKEAFSKLPGEPGLCNFYYHREQATHSPKMGLDCSNMVLMATQMAGLPYFFETSTTLAKFMKPIKRGQVVDDGDLIWFPGHVVAVSNAKKGLLIEARGYGGGYGLVHELPLNRMF
ncbi:hypothetical protein HOB95_01820, partial [bacterium]|nr:hypothetical protein [bacterium]